MKDETMLTETQAIEAAQKLIDEEKINCRLSKSYLRMKSFRHGKYGST
jgi:hypothetical protein